MFSILQFSSSARRSSRQTRRPRPARRPQRLKPALWLESLEDRTLLSGTPVGGGLALPASPLDPAVPGHFGQRNTAAARTESTAVAPSTPTSPFAAQAASPAGIPAAESVFAGGFPTIAAMGVNPLTGQSFSPGNPAANLLQAVANGTNPAGQVPPPVLAAQVGTTSLPTEQGLLADWMFQQHNLPLLLGSGGGENAMLGPNTQDNARATPRPALLPSAEQEESAPNLDNGGDGIDTTPPPAQAVPPERPGAAAPVTDGDEQQVLLIEPAVSEKLPGWEIVQETPAETVRPVEQAPVQAPATPAPLWLRFLSAVSFAAGAVGAVWVPKFGAAGMSREELLGLRRGRPAR
jgi:hypothetical protein